VKTSTQFYPCLSDFTDPVACFSSFLVVVVVVVLLLLLLRVGKSISCTAAAYRTACLWTTRSILGVNCCR
jgi:hypothetical protein